ncbi:hypothetical protein FJ366_01220 [Candidatus Dependentiae bacterium]|nr:hypothetical protein [Candidatus Dependentiae bacterium]
MFFTYKKKIAQVLLGILVMQPAMLLVAPSGLGEDMIEQNHLSLQKKELALVSQFLTLPLINNDKTTLFQGILPVSTNAKLISLLNDRMVISWDDLTTQKYFSTAEFEARKSRIKLLADLQLTNKDGQNSVVRSLGKTITRAGQACFVGLASQVDVNLPVVKRRQAFIKALVDSPALLKNVQSSLRSIAAHEDTLANQIPLAPNPFEAMSQAKKMMVIVGLEVALFYAVYLFNPAGYAWLKNMAIGNGLFGALYLIGKIAQTEAAGSLGVILQNLMYLGYFTLSAVAGLACLTNYRGAGQAVLSWITKGAKTDYTIIDRVALPALCAVLCYGIFNLVKWMKKYQEEAFATAQKLSTYVKGIDGLLAYLNASAVPVVNSEYLQSYETSLSAKWQELVSKASSSSFKEDQQYSMLSASHPKVLNMTKLLGETVSDFSSAVQFYGEVDAYAAIAQLIVDTQNATNDIGAPIRTCFAEFDEESSEARIIAEDMWHPILPQAVVRSNSIILGRTSDDAQNMIITGPNAAGKSVTMKSLLVNVLFAQNFGVACASKFVLTPYKKIIARFSSVDDTANNQSKFMAEAFDVVSVLKQADELQDGEKMLVVTDELFSGTEFDPAVLLSAELCAEIALNKKVNYVLATHYKDLTALKTMTNGAFENYKVTASVDDDFVVSYPYTLTPGVGDVNVAFDIFLDQMRKQKLSNPRLEQIIKNARNRSLR